MFVDYGFYLLTPDIPTNTLVLVTYEGVQR